MFANLAGPAFSLTDAPALRVLPTPGGRYALAYRGMLSNLRTIFVDAGSGDVLFKLSRIREESSIDLGTGLRGDLKKIVMQPLGSIFLTRDQVRPNELRTLDMGFDPDHFVNRLLEVFFDDAPAGDQDLLADTDNRWENGATDAFLRPFDTAALVGRAEQCVAGGLSDAEYDIVEFLLGFLDNAAYFPPGNPDSTGLIVFGEPFFLPRWSRASVDLVFADDDLVSITAGGFHAGGGLRLRF